LVAQINFNQVVLRGILALLLFAGSIHVRPEDLNRQWLNISFRVIFGRVLRVSFIPTDANGRLAFW